MSAETGGKGEGRNEAVEIIVAENSYEVLDFAREFLRRKYGITDVRDGRFKIIGSTEKAKETISIKVKGSLTTEISEALKEEFGKNVEIITVVQDIHEGSPPERGFRLRPFTDGDYLGYAGAGDFLDGSKPLIGDITVVDNKGNKFDGEVIYCGGDDGIIIEVDYTTEDGAGKSFIFPSAPAIIPSKKKGLKFIKRIFAEGEKSVEDLKNCGFVEV